MAGASAAMFKRLRSKHFEIVTLHHAEAILQHDIPDAVDDLEEVLDSLEIPVAELVQGGGGEAQVTQRLRRELANLGWKKHSFEIKKIVDGEEKETTSHEIDHVKRFKNGTFALEIEWNNKDPFFDRDLENFKRLHADGVISVGGIVTRGSSLQKSLRDLISEFAKKKRIAKEDDLRSFYEPTKRQVHMIRRAAKSRGFAKAWAHAFVSDKFGEATTHWRKLEERVKRGVGNPCPLLLIGIPKDVVRL